MSDTSTPLTGPDFTLGVPSSTIADRPRLGHADGEAVLLVRLDDGVVCAVSATCSHYGGPLADGYVLNGTVRCPWHHGCFSLRTGEALRPPPLFDLKRWRVEERDGTVFVREPIDAAPSPRTPPVTPASVVIVGAGAAGNAAAETLRREGYAGPITMIDADPGAPCDRPNLSKDYLAGNAKPEWIPLHGPEFYAEQRIALVSARVTKIDPAARSVTLDDGRAIGFGALVLATGAEAIKLPLPNAGTPIYTLRSLADSDAIIAAAAAATRVVVLGASFIGLEVAASLRARSLDVHVVAPEARPLDRVLGPQVGDFIRGLHEARGVVFHLGRSARALGVKSVSLDDGSTLDADFVVAGVGVRPVVALAEAAGLSLDRGVVVNEYLETSAAGVFAAGDIARWPDPHTGLPIRVEHWVLAERQGQTAARNVLGARQRFDAVPFFWSQHYDVAINYVGHAEKWDDVEIKGDLGSRDCSVTFCLHGKTQAMATIFRDEESLFQEVALERRDGAFMPSA